MQLIHVLLTSHRYPVARPTKRPSWSLRTMRSPPARPLLVIPFCGTTLLRWRQWRKTPSDWTITGPLRRRFPTQLPFFSLEMQIRANTVNYLAPCCKLDLLISFCTIFNNPALLGGMKGYGITNISQRLNQCSQVYICASRLVPLFDRLKPYTLSAVLGLHGGSLEAAEQQPMGEIAEMWRSQVTGLLL